MVSFRIPSWEEYADTAAELVKLRREAKLNGNFFVEPEAMAKPDKVPTILDDVKPFILFPFQLDVLLGKTYFCGAHCGYHEDEPKAKDGIANLGL